MDQLRRVPQRPRQPAVIPNLNTTFRTASRYPASGRATLGFERTRTVIISGRTRICASVSFDENDAPAFTRHAAPWPAARVPDAAPSRVSAPWFLARAHLWYHTSARCWGKPRSPLSVCVHHIMSIGMRKPATSRPCPVPSASPARCAPRPEHGTCRR
jgi:hypothetical protein